MRAAIIAAAVLIAATTSAGATGIIANTLNADGGRIELTDVPGVKADADCGGWIAKTWTGRSTDSYGCWDFGPEGDTVVIRWNSGRTMTYPAAGFTRTQYGEQLLRRKQQQ